jgi:hypothetical protein
VIAIVRRAVGAAPKWKMREKEKAMSMAGLLVGFSP